MRMMIDSLVLGTVNAPYSDKLDALTLAECLVEPHKSKAHAGPMSSFFYEVKPELQIEFAASHGISYAQLAAAAMDFDLWSGDTWPHSIAA
jgi:hypothetical protein